MLKLQGTPSDPCEGSVEVADTCWTMYTFLSNWKQKGYSIYTFIYLV